MNKNDLVTVFGASGFVGRHAVRSLAKNGWRIRAVCRKPNLANFLLPAGHVGQIQLMKGNINEDDDVARALHGAGAVVNATGVLWGHGEQGFDAINAEAPRRIGAAAHAAGIQALIHISAIGADPDAESSYATSKGCGERDLREEYPDATILRPSLVFGPEDKFFNKFASLARLAPALPLIGGGHTRFQPVWVADIADAIVRTLSLEEARGQTYELGGPAIFTFKELLQFILHETGRRRMLVPVPFPLALIQAFFLQITGWVGITPLLTMDQVTLLKSDNVVHEGARTFADLGIKPSTIEGIVPSYIWRFRPKGEFGRTARSESSSTV
jgi:NADH dehydrogenase